MYSSRLCHRRAGLLCSAFLLLAAVLGLSCNRFSSRPVERIAYLRFENLTNDRSLDWMGSGIAVVLQDQTSGVPGVYCISSATVHELERALGPRPADAPGISTERTEALLAGATRIVYGEFSIAGDRMRLAATMQDPGSRKTVRTAIAMGPTSEGIIPLAAAVARQLNAKVRPFGTRNQGALKAYVEASRSSDAATAENSLERAIAADPNFGDPYIASVQLAVARQDDATAERILNMARARGDGISELDRARLNVQAAMLRGNLDGRMRALFALARLDPSNPTIYRNLAQTALSARQLGDAIQNFEQAVKILPDDVGLWNSLGYARAYVADLSGATQALEKYRQLRPNDANPLDSLGDVHFYLGKFADAEKYYLAAWRKDPGFLNGGETLKAAHARLMTGDVQAADKIFQRYLQGRQAANDPLLEFRQAEWEYLTGQRRAAVERLTAFARKLESSPQRDAASRAYAQLALWSLELGNRTPAREEALKATSLAAPPSAGLALLVKFLTEPEVAPAELKSRADRFFPGEAPTNLKEFAVAYAMLFDKQFRPAVPYLNGIYQQTNPDSQEGIPVLMAWAYLGGGHASDAARLVGGFPIPEAGGLEIFRSLYIPRIFFLRGEVFAKQDKREEARQNYRVFLTLSGSEPEIWGEEALAKQALTQ